MHLKNEEGLVGGILIGAIVGAILVIWLIFKLLGAIF